MPVPLLPLAYGAGALAMRYAPQALRGFQAWMRSPASREMAMRTARRIPATIIGDYAADKLGKLANNSDLEDMADVVGIANAVRKLNPYQATIETGLAAIDPNWERAANKVISLGATAANAQELTPDDINHSVFSQSNGFKSYNPQQSIPIANYNDPRDAPQDMTNMYNTKLSPWMQKDYDRWMKTLPKNYQSTYDYDMQGYYRARRLGLVDTSQDIKGNIHLVDQFKKPNHPTFSDQSMYHGVDGHYGGSWEETGPNRYRYYVNETSMASPQFLRDRYWPRVEPNNTLIDQRGY